MRADEVPEMSGGEVALLLEKPQPIELPLKPWRSDYIGYKTTTKI
jgi:hypothetical protein